MESIGAVLSWAVFGLIVGVIARFLYPGRQPIGILLTIVLGIVGSLVGGFISSAVSGHGVGFHGAGWIMSIVGVLIVVWGYLAFAGRRSG